MKKLLFLAVVLAAACSFAEFKVNPDENTLWIEDGLNNFDGWREGLLMKSAEGGIFTIQPGTGISGGRYVPNHEDYPWLTFEIASLNRTGGYRGLNFTNCLAIVSNPMPGIYAVKREIKQKSSYLRLDIHGLILGFKYIKQVKKPDYYIDAAKTDKGVEITVYLKDAAEDVSISFYNSYTMPRLTFDNEYKLQLLPKDESNPVVWSGTIKNCTYSTKHDVILKATVLGGKIKVPIWGKLDKKLYTK